MREHSDSVHRVNEGVGDSVLAQPFSDYGASGPSGNFFNRGFGPWRTVVRVVGNVKSTSGSMQEPDPMLLHFPHTPQIFSPFVGAGSLNVVGGAESRVIPFQRGPKPC